MTRNPLPVAQPKTANLAVQTALVAAAVVSGSIGAVALGSAGLPWPVTVVVAAVWVAVCLGGLVLLERRRRESRSRSSRGTWAEHVQELRSSRLEIVNAFEIERQRVERDLHDGAQQYIVGAAMKIGEAVMILSRSETSPGSRDEALLLLASAQDCADDALAALRETVSGIHPTVLSDLGLESAVRELAARSPIDSVVRVPHPLPAIPEGVAAAAYFLVSEAVVNVAKHAPLARVTVLLSADEQLHISVVDNGPGGAWLQPGHGLAGMAERLAAFGGTLQLASPAGGPTSVTCRLPLLLSIGASGIPAKTTRPEEDRP